jgi:hypothetical protein
MRWYPRSWRQSHVEEFQALLEDSIRERPVWAFRSIDIAVQGTRVRLAELDRRARTNLGRRPTVKTKIGRLASIIFWSYALLFASFGGTHGYGLRSGTLGVVVVASALTLVGGLAVFAGMAWAIVGRSTRRSWPLIALGSSLVALVALDLSLSAHAQHWGGAAIRDLFLGLWPGAWISTYGGPHAFVAGFGRTQASVETYLWLNVSLVVVGAISLTALMRRIRPSPIRRFRAHRHLADVATVLIIAAAWVQGAGYPFFGLAGTENLFSQYSIVVVLTISGVARYLVERDGRPYRSTAPS